MIKALLLIFEGGTAWDRVVETRRGLLFVFLTYLLPMLLIVSLVEGWGMMHWGKWQSSLQNLREFDLNEAVFFEVVQFSLSLAVVFVGAHLIKILGQTFHGRNTYAQGFTAAAYGLSPMFLLRLMDIFPGMNPWASWGIGIALSVWVLYQGLPRVMLPDPTHALGLYFVTSIVLILLTGLGRLFTALYLSGRITLEHSYLWRFIQHHL